MLFFFYTLYARAYQFVFRLVSPLLPWRTPQLIEGENSLHRLPGLIKSLGLSGILFVTDKGIIKAGIANDLLAKLESEGINVSIYDEVVPNPNIGNIESALRLYNKNECMGIVAFGGGSAMDCAKIVGARAVRPKKPVSAMAGLFKVLKRLPPLIVIPTTAGTGSETTLAAVITDTASHRKYPINDFSLIPGWAILDPVLLVGLPAPITATTGMDALTHAVEAFIGGSNTRGTEKDALEAAKLVLENLESVYKEPAKLAGRMAMLKAAYLAGRAFTKAYVGNVHAMAHALGGLYGIAHGLANAVILPHVLEYYGKRAHKRLAIMARACIPDLNDVDDASLANSFIERIQSMNKAMGIALYLKEIKEDDISFLARHAFKEANPLYPVPMVLSKKSFAELFRIVRGH